MGRGNFRGGGRGFPPHRDRSKYTSMLDMRRLEHFRYDAKNLLERSGVEDRVWTPLLATVIAKASNTNINEAKDYIRAKFDEGVLPEDTARGLSRLLDRFRRMR